MSSTLIAARIGEPVRVVESAMMQLAEYGLASREWQDETIRLELSTSILKNRAPMRKQKPELELIYGGAA